MYQFEPIAIVGQGCVLPGCLSPKKLWDSVLHNRIHMTSPPENSWRVSMDRVLSSVAGKYIHDKSWTNLGGYITGFNSVFNQDKYTSNSTPIANLDPLFHWALHAAEQALEQINNISDIKEKAGVILGNLGYPTRRASQLYETEILNPLIGNKKTSEQNVHPINRFMSGYPAVFIGNSFEFKGDCFCLDAACASALYAIKLACDKLQNREADLMLAGGVNASDPLFLHVGFCALKAMSVSGQSRPFHNQADGLIPAEGVALVSLKRLDDAIKANDNIHGVIRGIGLSNDGRSGGFLLPSEEGQVQCMNNAFQQSGIKPSRVSLIECHATGTENGDRAEIHSMAKVFGIKSDIVIGSLKANIGHTITASGAAGLIKVLHAFQHNQLPSTPNAHPVINAINDSPFKVLQKPENWADTPQPKVVCVSSFGFGGNNAHLIVEEWTEKSPSGRPRKPIKCQQTAVIGMAVQTHKTSTINELTELLFNTPANFQEERKLNNRSVCFSPDEIVFPPKDLDQTMGPQLLLLKVAGEAISSSGISDTKNMGIFIGCGLDMNVCRYGLRMRLDDLLKSLDPEIAKKIDTGKMKDFIIPALGPASVIGTMPNIPANRLNNQFKCCGPGFTVNGEELSGDIALQLAQDALTKKEIKSALVGAVDFSNEAVHELSMKKVSNGKAPDSGNAAIVLILKTLEDAQKNGDHILAILNSSNKNPDVAASDSLGNTKIIQSIGSAHTASGLLHIGENILKINGNLQYKSDHSKTIPYIPKSKRRIEFFRNHSFTKRQKTWTIEKFEDSYSFRYPPISHPNLYLYAAENVDELAQMLKHDTQSESGSCRLAYFANPKDRQDVHKEANKILLKNNDKRRWSTGPVCFSREPVKGKIGFMFTGAASAYPDMGLDLMLAFPQLVRDICNSVDSIDEVMNWIINDHKNDLLNPLDQLYGASFLCQFHSILSTKVLGIKPDAVLGLSSGETNGLLAMGVWKSINDIFAEIRRTKLYSKELGGEFNALRQYWNLPGNSAIVWENWRLFFPVSQIQEFVKDTKKVFLTIINTDNDCIIGGEQQECRSLVNRVGRENCIIQPHHLVVHCPAIKPFKETWHAIHNLPSKSLGKIKFYSSFYGKSYKINRKNVAKALTDQASNTINFPKVVNQAWRDGVRIFLEHGPRNSLSSSVASILDTKDPLTVSMDTSEKSSLDQFYSSVIQLWCAGASMNLDTLKEFSEKSAITKTHQPTTDGMEFSLYHPDLANDEWIQNFNTDQHQSSNANPQFNINPKNSIANLIRYQQTRVEEIHRDFLTQQQRTQEAFNLINTKIDHCLKTEANQDQFDFESGPSGAPEGPRFDYDDLIIHASGIISTLFGKEFKQQDDYDVQVRMPEPPLLLCDRITGIKGESGKMGLGTVWTESEVLPDKWYLQNGRMPAGILIESGQADLFLISWLGIDFHNKGKRAYRLLGCEITFQDSLPKPGDILKYKIDIDGYANHGDVRLFLFHYDCRVNDKIKISVRNGQAGFFTKDELKNSTGIIWDPADANYTKLKRKSSSRLTCDKSSFNRDEVESYHDGNISICFGDQYKRTCTHTRTPLHQCGTHSFFDKIPHFDINGGPMQRGYMRATSQVNASDWYFKGHFKNDPCMPGTLMAEACLQTMAFYLTAIGYTVDKDGWRFEPVHNIEYKFVCRGQVTPSSKEIVYELFVDEIIDAPYPTLFAHVLCSVDGLNAFMCERLGIQLVPDWPMTSLPNSVDNSGINYGPPAQLNGFNFDYQALKQCAIGQPSRAFGKGFSHYDGIFRCPRLPGEPYHFITQINRYNAEVGVMKEGVSAEVIFQVKKDAWYFADNTSSTMPFCVLMEIGLQPCGWLATLVLERHLSQTELLFRNLDGIATQYKEVIPQDSTITTKVKLLSVSQFEGLVIYKFNVNCSIENDLFLSMTTDFGFFKPEALAAQSGLPASEEDIKQFNMPSSCSINLHDPASSFVNSNNASLTKSKLLMIDRISVLEKNGGKLGLGYIRTEKNVNANEWFFKAHFFQDPVQPGSLGIEAMIQTITCLMIEKGYSENFSNPYFKPTICGAETEWHYRGQVLPENELVIIEFEVLKEICNDISVEIHGESRLWIDGVLIYKTPKIGVELIDNMVKENPQQSSYDWTMLLKENQWVHDHCPTYTIPALPLVYQIDMMARSTVGLFKDKVLKSVNSISARNWALFSGEELSGRIVTDQLGRGNFNIDLQILDNKSKSTQYTTISDGSFSFGTTFNKAKFDNLQDLVNGVSTKNPYSTFKTFHGPSFQLMSDWIIGDNGADYTLHAKIVNVPAGVINPAVIDASLHSIPHDDLSIWCGEPATDHIAYPIEIYNMLFYQAIPTIGELHCQCRFIKLQSKKFPLFKMLIKNDKGDPVLSFDLKEILLPKGRLSHSSAEELRSFLLKKKYIENLSVTQHTGLNRSILHIKDVKECDWLPGTISAIYNKNDASPGLPVHIAISEHIAHIIKLHPSKIKVANNSGQCNNLPLNRFIVQTKKTRDSVEVTQKINEREIDWKSILNYWVLENNSKQSIIHDLVCSLIKQFVRRVIIEDPDSFFRLKGKPVLYLANHQVGVESLLAMTIAGMLLNGRSNVIVKQEHKQSWLGKLNALADTILPGHMPIGMLFFDRKKQESFLTLLKTISVGLNETPNSLLIHTEGTRSTHSGIPVKNLSSVLIDFSIKNDMPIVPIRFVGGLPVKNDQPLVFPHRFGKQDYYFGSPIHTNEFISLSLMDRSAKVLNALNDLGPDPTLEKPIAARNKISNKLNSIVKNKDNTNYKAVLFELLKQFPSPSDETIKILNIMGKSHGKIPRELRNSKLKFIIDYLEKITHG